jgi:ubiquinone biosynthesis protein COQ9
MITRAANSQTAWADAKEQAVLDAALVLAPVLGWGGNLSTRAGAVAGLTAAETDLLVPHGSRDLAALLSRRCDAAAIAALANTDARTLKVRERIRTGVIARLDTHREYQPAARRCMGFLSLPANLPLASRLLWEAADVIWRWAGDTSTDENHYSKRAILSGLLAAVLAVDLAQGREAAIIQLDARLANVMAFEKWKAGIKPSQLVRQTAEALGRLRYRQG